MDANQGGDPPHPPTSSASSFCHWTLSEPFGGISNPAFLFWWLQQVQQPVSPAPALDGQLHPSFSGTNQGPRLPSGMWQLLPPGTPLPAPSMPAGQQAPPIQQAPVDQQTPATVSTGEQISQQVPPIQQAPVDQQIPATASTEEQVSQQALAGQQARFLCLLLRSTVPTVRDIFKGCKKGTDAFEALKKELKTKNGRLDPPDPGPVLTKRRRHF